MNRPLRFLPAYIFLFLFFGFSLSGLAQVSTAVINAANPRHETINQNQIDVLFNKPIKGTSPIGDWEVRINGTLVTVEGVAVNAPAPALPNTVRVTFNALNVNAGPDVSPIAGVQSPLLPGQTLSIRFTNSGSLLTNDPGNPSDNSPAASFGTTPSNNNFALDCGDLGFSNSGNFAGVDVCAPVDMNFFQWTYFMSVRLRNSTSYQPSAGLNGAFKLIVNYGNPANTATAYYPFQSNGAADPQPSTTYYTIGSLQSGLTGPVLSWSIKPTDFSYPDNSGWCSFNSTVTPEFHNLLPCGVGTLSRATTFISYDNDDENTGTVRILPSVAGSNLVCRGTNANITYSDNTTLNCQGPPLPSTITPTTANQNIRWMRVVYGYQNAPAPGNIPNIVVGGIPVTDASGNMIAPFNSSPVPGVAQGYVPIGPGGVGNPDANGVFEFATPVTIASGTAFIKNIITSSFAGQVFDQRFYVRIDYWNTCNRYDLGANPVSKDHFIQIIQSPDPPTVNNPILCETASNNSFEITAGPSGPTTGTLTYRWYLEPALTTLLQGPSTDNTFNPVTEGPTTNRIAKAVTGSQTYHRYVTVTQGSNNCTSAAADITIRIDDTNTGGAIAHALGASPITVCTGTNPIAFTSPTDATGGGPSGTVTYQWQSATNASFTAGVTTVGTNSNVFDPPAVTGAIYYRRRAISGSCADAFSNIIGFLIDTPVTGGSIDADQIICSDPENGNPAPLTNLGLPTGGDRLGNYSYQWESSTTGVGGPFASIGSAIASTYDPPAGLTVTTYYRRKVTSGICSGDANLDGAPDNVAYSNVVTVTVQPVIDPGAISTDETICAGGNPIAFVSDAPATGGNGTLNYQWQSSTTSAIAGFSNIGSATGITYDAPAGLVTTTWYRRSVSAGVCNAQFTNAVKVTVNPLPTAPAPTGGGAVCSGNPAPDIVWTGLTGTPGFTITYTITKNPGAVVTTVGPIAVPTTTFTISSPNPVGISGDTFDYKITALSDANCSASAAVLTAIPSRQVTIGGTAPVVDVLPTISPIADCNNGSTTTDPQLSLSLTAASASTNGFILNYIIDGSSNRTKTFNTDAAGDIAAGTPITFADTELNNLTPSPHVIRIVSIQSPTGCLTLVGDDLNFTVNPRPAVPTGANNGTACSNPGTGVALSVTAPATGFEIAWSTVGPALASFAAVSTGTVSGINNNIYTPATSATATYYAFMRNTTTGCLSTTGLAVTQTQDNKPANADAGPDQSLLCGTSATMAAVAVTNSGTGTWTVITTGYPGITITNNHLRNTTVTGLPQDVPNGSPISITLRWTAASALGVCATTDDDIILTINPLPKALDPTPVLCADVAGGSTVSGVVLSGYNDRVTDIPGSTDRTVTYYSNAARTLVVSTPQTFATGQIFYTRVENTVTGCRKDGTITFTVEQLPAAVQNKVYEFCESGVGTGTFGGINLVTLVNTDIIGSAPATTANRLVEWFDDAAFTTPIASGTGVGQDQNYSLTSIGTKTIYARITNLSSASTTPLGTPSKCTNTTSVDLILNARPINNPIQDPSGATPASVTLCKSNSTLIFQVDPSANPGSTYTWTVPPQFDLFAGGGTNSSNFFVLLKFPNTVTSPGLALQVQETRNGCAGNIQTINIIVDDSPARPVIKGPDNVCENQTGVNFFIETPNPTSTYSWSLPPLAVISGSNANKSSINVDFNVFAGDVNVSEQSNTGCTSDPAFAHPVNIFARPLVTSSNTTICSGTSPVTNGYNLMSSISASTFNWQVVSITGSVIGTAIGNVATNSQLTETITNISGSLALVTYRVTPIGPAPGLCSGPTTDIVVTINPQPIITSPATNTICSKGTVAPFTADVIGTTFTWTVININGIVSGTNIGDTGAGNINQTLVNTSGANAIITYRVVPKSPPPCIGAFQDIDVTVISEPVITSLATNEICSGNQPTLTFTSNVPGSTFNWVVVAKDLAVTGTTVGSAGSGNINQTLSNVSGATATVTFRVTPSGPGPNNCFGDFQDVVVTVDPQPVMTSASSFTTCSGVAPTPFNLTSNLPGSTFAWTVTNITGTIGGTALGNTGTGNLNEAITNTSGTNATVTYRVVPTGPAPSHCPGAFQNVILTIAPEPVMTSAASNTICGGGVPTLVFASNIPGSTFTWTVTGITGTVGGTAIGNTGSGNINQTLTNISGSAATVTYEVVPTGPNPNNCVGALQVITINVIPQPNMTSAATDNICSGSTPGVLFTADVPSSTFTWTVTAISGTITGTSIGNTGSGNVGQTLTNTSGIDGTVTYRVTPTSPSPDNCTGFPQDFVVTVVSQPVMSSPTTNTICSGLAPTLVFNSTITGSTFTWEVIAKSGVIGGATIGNTGSGNINQVLTNTSGVNGTVTYRVTPTGPGPKNCIGAFQDVVITVNPEPVMTSGVTATICSGLVPGVSFTSNVASSTFAWTVTGITGTVGGAAIGNSGTGNISHVLTNTSGATATVTYDITPTGPAPSNCLGATQTLVVTVIPQPVMTSPPANTVCSGGTPGITFVANVAGGTFAWTVTGVSASVSGAVVGNSGTGTSIGQTLVNTSGSNGTVTYQVVPTGPNPTDCVGAAQTVTITVVSQPVMTSAALNTICSDLAPTLTFNTNITGSTFAWQVIAIGGSVGGTTIGSAGTGNLSEVLTNTSGVNGTVTYRVTPTGPGPNNCEGAFQDVIITVISKPVMTSAATNKICSGSVPSISFTSNILSSTFAWEVTNISGSVTGTSVGSAGTGNITDVLVNKSGVVSIVTYKVTPTGPTPSNCPGAQQNVVVTVMPEPVMTSASTARICSGSTPSSNLTFTSNVAGSTFAWQVTAMSASVTGTSVGAIGVGNIAHTLTNTSGSNGTVTYSVTPTSPSPDNCIGDAQIVIVTVVSQPVMTSASAKTICSGNTPGLIFTANVAASTFSWEVVNISGAITGTALTNTGSGNITQVLSNVSGTSGSVTYRVTPTGPGADNCVGAPQDVIITVTPQPIMTSPATDNICSGNTPTIIFTSNVLGSSFAWTVTNVTGAVSGALVGNSGSGAITQTLVNVSNVSGTVTYRVIPSGPVPLNCPGIFQDLVVTVNPEPTAPLVTTIERCSRELLNFDLQTLINNSPAPVSSKFRYTVSVEPGPASSEVAISGLDRTTASTDPINDSFTHLAIASNADAVVVYTVTPFSTSDNCPGTPFKLRVIVHPEPRGTAATFALCTTPLTGSALNQNLGLQIVNGVASKFTYQFIPDPSNPTVVPTTPPPYDRTVASTANITDNFLNNTGNVAVVTYVVTPFSTSKSCEGAPFTYQVTINTNPVGTPTTIAQVCSNTPVSFDPQIQTAVTSTFTWTVTHATGLVVKTPGTGNGVISETLLNRTSGNAVLNAVYHVTPKAGSCTGSIFDITVPIKPEPVVATNLNETQCSGVIYGKDLATVTGSSASVAAATYDITATVHPDLIGTATVGTGLLATAIRNDAFINRKSTPLTVVYHVVPHASAANGGCVGESQDIFFTVNAEPVLDIAPPPPVCSTNSNVIAPINVVLGTDGTSVNAASYQVKSIQYSTTGISGPFSAALPTGFTANASNAPLNVDRTFNSVKDDKYNNKRNGAVTVRYTIQGKSSGGCLSAAVDFFIDINPEPILDPALSPTPICSGEKIDPTGTTFELRSLATSVPSTMFIIRSINANGLTPALTNASLGVQINKDGIDNDTYTNIISPSFVNVVYTITPISADGCLGEDQTVTIRVNPAPGLKAGLDKLVCNQANSNIVLVDNSPTSAPASQYRLEGITVGPSNIPITPGATVAGLIANAANRAIGATAGTSLISADNYTNTTPDRITVRYEIVAIAATGCEATGFVTLTVEPAIVSTSSIADADICSGDAITVTFNTSTYANGDPTNPVLTYSYSMAYVAPATTGVTGNTVGNNLLKDPSGTDISDVLINSTNSAIQVKYKITPRAIGAAGGLGCAGVVQEILLTVQPRPKINPIADKTVCENNPINLNLVSPTVPSTGVIKFRLTSILPETAAVAGFTAVNTLIPNNTLLGDVLSNTDVVQRYVDYTFEPVNVDATDAVICANGTPITVRVTVNPRPDVTPSATTLEICSSESIEVQLPTDTDPSSTIVKWTALASSVDVVGESNGAGDILFQTLLNKGNVVQTVTYTITPSFNGCDGASKQLMVTVNPIPTVILPNKITVCAGTTFNLNLAPLANTTTATTFKWEVTDINGIGTPGQFDNTSETATAISQVFTNNTDASATLLYEITPIFNGVGGKCYGIPKIINVSVAPTITAAFISTDEGICEGTPIFLTFELHGQSPFDFVYSATDASGTVNKTVTKSGNVKVDKVTPTITTTYKIVSAKDALGCAVNFSPQPEVTITVYKKITAGWTASIPPFVGGSSIVTFTNTSTPVDGSTFNYEWTFGTDNYVIPQTNTGVGPFNADYRRPGDHYVSLRAVNKFAPVDLGCESTYTAKITIPVLPLVADFKFEPKAACFPQNIQVTENTATGVAMDWKVTDSNNSIVATSNANLPEFLITSPGKYKISLRTYDPLTNQEAFAPTAGKDFTIYDNPVASFDVRPTLVYVPDTELTTFNFSTGAPEYLWDFGDGSISTEPEPKYTYKIEGIYDITLVAINDHGDGAVCTDTLSRKITAKQGGVTKVPNAFTPSPNGPSGGIAGNNTFNDVFLPIVKGAEEFNMQIFDRWGNLIFESNNSNMGWDGYDKNGKLMPAGVYVYKLTVRLSDGQRSTQIGDITMIR